MNEVTVIIMGGEVKDFLTTVLYVKRWCEEGGPKLSGVNFTIILWAAFVPLDECWTCSECTAKKIERNF